MSPTDHFSIFSKKNNCLRIGLRQSVYPLWNVGSSGFTLNHDAICAQVKTKSILAAFVDYRPNPLIDSEVISSLEADQLLTSVGSFPDRLNETKACLRKILSQKELTPFHDPNIDALGHRAVIQRSAIERVLTASVLGKELKKIIETATIEKQTWSSPTDLVHRYS